MKRMLLRRRLARQPAACLASLPAPALVTWVHLGEARSRYTFEAGPGIKSKARPKVVPVAALEAGMAALVNKRAALAKAEAASAAGAACVAGLVERRRRRCERMRPLGELHLRAAALREQVREEHPGEASKCGRNTRGRNTRGRRAGAGGTPGGGTPGGGKPGGGTPGVAGGCKAGCGGCTAGCGELAAGCG
eukprot:907651-Prorocentrum_minimum.AAC.1